MRHQTTVHNSQKFKKYTLQTAYKIINHLVLQTKIKLTSKVCLIGNLI